MNKQHLLRATSAVALLAAMGTAAISQTGGSGQPGPSGQGGAPTQTQQRQDDRTPDATRPSSPRSEQPDKQTPRASDRAQEKASPNSRVQGQTDSPKSTSRPDKASPKSSADEGKGDERRRTTGERQPDSKDRQRESSERAKDSKDTQRQSSDRAKDGKDAQQRSEEPSRDRSKSASDREQKDGDRTRQGRADERGPGERVQLSQQQRTTVRERLVQRSKGNRVTNVNFDIRVGASVPRSVTLVTLPPDIIEIVPEYRGYQYVYAGDSILIVDTNYVVVAVLGSDSRVVSRPGGRLTVSANDRVFIRQHVDRSFSIRLGIGGINLGMKLPTDVELRPLPVTIAERVPDLRNHSYFVYEDEIVIVDPDTREVVLVIED